MQNHGVLIKITINKEVQFIFVYSLKQILKS